MIGKIAIELAFPRNYNLGARGTGSSNPLCSQREVFYKPDFRVHIVRSRARPYRGEWSTMSGGPMVRIPLPVAKPVELDAGLANRGHYTKVL